MGHTLNNLNTYTESCSRNEVLLPKKQEKMAKITENQQKIINSATLSELLAWHDELNKCCDNTELNKLKRAIRKRAKELTNEIQKKM